MSGREMKEAVVPGPLTEFLKLGAAIRKAREKGSRVLDPTYFGFKLRYTLIEKLFG